MDPNLMRMSNLARVGLIYETLIFFQQKEFAQLIRHGRPLEGRTVEECQQCCEHLLRTRVAFFGSSFSRRASSNGSFSSRVSFASSPTTGSSASSPGIDVAAARRSLRHSGRFSQTAPAAGRR
jgi:hypothetical protein